MRSGAAHRENPANERVEVGQLARSLAVCARLSGVGSHIHAAVQTGIPCKDGRHRGLVSVANGSDSSAPTTHLGEHAGI
eukprot:11328894-Prorocentrum_lima.AAC.1